MLTKLYVIKEDGYQNYSNGPSGYTLRYEFDGGQRREWYDADGNSYIFITDTYLKSNPFNSWACALEFYQIEYHTDDVNLGDVQYSISRIRAREEVEETPYSKNCVFSMDYKNNINFLGCELKLSQRLNITDRCYLLRKILEITF